MHSHQKTHKPILEMPAASCREFFWFAFKDTKHCKGLLFGREGTGIESWPSVCVERSDVGVNRPGFKSCLCHQQAGRTSGSSLHFSWVWLSPSVNGDIDLSLWRWWALCEMMIVWFLLPCLGHAGCAPINTRAMKTHNYSEVIEYLPRSLTEVFKESILSPAFINPINR